MAYDREVASGQSLIHLQNMFDSFQEKMKVQEVSSNGVTAKFDECTRRNWKPHRVISIDGSNIAQPVQNGFPGAEVGMVSLSVVVIDVTKLHEANPQEQLSPRVFREMERDWTFGTIVPGANVVRSSMKTDSPMEFFREEVYRSVRGRFDDSHETLLETFRAITSTRGASKIDCPIEGCMHQFSKGHQQYNCLCEREKYLFETDELRLHERFKEYGSNGEVFGELRHVLELLSLINILRFFAHEDRVNFFEDCAFVVDGPLAVFGQPAWLKPYVQAEISRIDKFCRDKIGRGLALFGVEKSGAFYEHLVALDTHETGSRGKLAAQKHFIPESEYINRSIVYRPKGSKIYGLATYFGRKVLYKSKTGNHVVVNVPFTEGKDENIENSSNMNLERLPDIFDVVDDLSSYLYQDSFLPLIKAHSHAAIPLAMGGKILSNLIDKGGA